MDEKPEDNDDSTKVKVRTAPPVPAELKSDLPDTPNDDAEPDDTSEDDAPDSETSGDDQPPEKDSDRVTTASPPKRPNFFKRLLAGYWHEKRWTLPLTLLAILIIVFAVPQSRYPILGLGLKRPFSLTVLDSKTGTPVSGATISYDGKSAETDGSGLVHISLPVGKRTVEVSKKYYKNMNDSVFVGIMTTHNSASAKLTATGRQVPIKVVNKINGEPVAGAEIKVLDTEAKTNGKGMATIVLPTSSPTQTVMLTGSGYNKLSNHVQVTNKVVAANTFAMTPAGRIYFLSNASGNIDVVSTNLDGTGRQTVLAGTGDEDSSDTVLLASRDWKYLALLSKRDGGKYPKMFLISTANGKLTTMDEGTATFTPIGWSDHTFVYQVSRDDVSAWQPGQSAIKSYNADTGKLATIDQTNAEGSQSSYNSQTIAFTNIIDDRIVYGFAWYAQYYDGNLKNSIMSAKVDGSAKQDLRDIPLGSASYSSMSSVAVEPETLDIQTYVGSQSPVYYVYRDENNSLSQSSTITNDSYNQAQQNYVTYLISPSSKGSFWSEQRDGKNTLFVGDYSGSSGKQIATASDYTPYGWYTDSYVLMQKSNSELYIMSAGGGTALKISDYYKPPQNFYGYGGGYGGL